MEAIQRRKSSLLKRTAMVARMVASGDREQEQRAPDKEQERDAWDGRGRGGPRPMAGEVEGLRDGQRPHGKGRGEGAELGVLGAPVDADLRQGKAPR